MAAKIINFQTRACKLCQCTVFYFRKRLCHDIGNNLRAPEIKYKPRNTCFFNFPRLTTWNNKNNFARYVATDSSEVEKDLDDIRTLLKSNLSHDKTYSDVDVQKQMDILEVLFGNRLSMVSQREFNEAISTSTPTEMYNLASRIFSLQSKVGDEAGMVATPLFRAAAMAGSKNAKYSYGQLLFRGAGGLESAPLEAASMFKELAEEGHPYAQFALASMYYSGLGVEQSFETAYTLYQVAAENGVVQSFNSLGKMYLNGDGVDKNEEKAFSYFLKGVDQGDTQACMSLAHCYSHGKGMEVDYDQAFAYHNKAAEAGYPPAIYNVGTHYFSGKGIELDMTKAAECFQRAADLGFTMAEVNLGNMYYHGLGVEQNTSKAKELYQKAAPKHHNARLLLEELELEEKKQDDESKE